eukprot:9474695-Pyramimonas_sp.AAC.1
MGDESPPDWGIRASGSSSSPERVRRRSRSRPLEGARVFEGARPPPANLARSRPTRASSRAAKEERPTPGPLPTQPTRAAKDDLSNCDFQNITIGFVNVGGNRAPGLARNAVQNDLNDLPAGIVGMCECSDYAWGAIVDPSVRASEHDDRERTKAWHGIRGT